jgi:hypothetical protein
MLCIFVDMKLPGSLLILLVNWDERMFNWMVLDVNRLDV